MSKKRVIIVGGGTAGYVIANNIKGYCDVTIIDKCAYKKYPLIYRVPLMIGILFRKKILKYVIKRNLFVENGRCIPFFESNVFGGASVINGCVHTVGCRSIWERLLERYNSNYEDLMHSYQRLYSNDQAAKNKISLALAPQNIVDFSFAAALDTHGIQYGDMNFADSESRGPIHNTRKGLFRTSVLSLKNKGELKIRIGEFVENIKLDSNGVVTGVQTNKGFMQSDCVILSAGVIGTCKLLMDPIFRDAASPLIGKLNIGSNIQDHTNLRVNVTTKQPIGSLNEIVPSYLKKAAMLVKHFLGIPTLMVGTGATSGVHLDLNGDGVVDTRIHVLQFAETGRHGSDGKFFSDAPGFSLSITPIAPESRGEIKLCCKEITVDPQYLSNVRDVEILKQALKYSLKLLRTEPLANIVSEIVNEKQMEEDPERYIFENFYSGHHLIGGCQDAVDSKFKVKGVEGLYVCDASIISEYPASNIHSSVVLLSDIFSKKFELESRVKESV